jgi:hypothetical protein
MMPRQQRRKLIEPPPQSRDMPPGMAPGKPLRSGVGGAAGQRQLPLRR